MSARTHLVQDTGFKLDPDSQVPDISTLNLTDRDGPVGVLDRNQKPDPKLPRSKKPASRQSSKVKSEPRKQLRPHHASGIPKVKLKEQRHVSKKQNRRVLSDEEEEVLQDTEEHEGPARYWHSARGTAATAADAEIVGLCGDFVQSYIQALEDRRLRPPVLRSRPPLFGNNPYNTEPFRAESFGRELDFPLGPPSLESRSEVGRHSRSTAEANERNSDSLSDRSSVLSGPTVLHRAELYRLAKPYLSSNALEPRLSRVVVHNDPIETKHTKGLTYHEVDNHPPIFEVTTLYGAPPKRGVSNHQGFYPQADRFYTPAVRDPLGDEDTNLPEERVIAGETVDVGIEAGTIITVNSGHIIEALESIYDYPDNLIFDGESLLVPEPFCILLQYRDEMLQHRDMLLQHNKQISVNESSQTENGPHAVRIDGRVQDSRAIDLGEAARDITELYHFLDSKYQGSMLAEQERTHQPQPTCTFEWVWLLFKQDVLVCCKEEGKFKVFSVRAVKFKGLFHYDRKTKKPSINPRRLKNRRQLKFKHQLEKIILQLAFMEFDGERLIEVEKRVTILPFDGEKLIVDLPVFPIKFLEDPEGVIAARLLERGKRYVSLTKPSHRQLTGQTLSVPRRWVHSRVVVDTATYLQSDSVSGDGRYRFNGRDDYAPYPPRIISPNSSPQSSSGDDDEPSNYRPRLRRARRYGSPRRGRDRTRKTKGHRIDPAKEDEYKKINDNMYMICAGEVHAYILREREWALVDVEDISECKFDDRMIDDLVISDEAKRLIQALSTTYGLDQRSEGSSEGKRFSTAWSADLVQNKGEGQILLLHGKPGVGKTLTAECVAELTRRPLLSITCGDMGIYADTLEYELNEWLRLGTSWNAVLLFDEADVYLESRRQADLNRNGVVSVFLRALEYYQGLLFLTTNRVGTFDEAILSRVHVVLHYPDLTDRERERIWETAFRRLGEDRPNMKFGMTLLDYAYRDDEIKALAWNGREIGNAFNTMIALAMWDAQQNKKATKDGKIEVKREHLQQVATMSGSFKKYLLSLRGVDQAMHAKMMNLRDDEFKK